MLREDSVYIPVEEVSEEGAPSRGLVSSSLRRKHAGFGGRWWGDAGRVGGGCSFHSSPHSARICFTSDTSRARCGPPNTPTTLDARPSPSQSLSRAGSHPGYTSKSPGGFKKVTCLGSQSPCIEWPSLSGRVGGHPACFEQLFWRSQCVAGVENPALGVRKSGCDPGPRAR